MAAVNPGPPLDPLRELILPQHIDDRTLATLVEFLHDLARLIENRYLGQLHRNRADQCQAPGQPDTEPESIPDPPF